jgi:hypothetical protein
MNERAVSPQVQIEQRDEALSREGEGKRALMRSIRDGIFVYLAGGVAIPASVVALQDHMQAKQREQEIMVQELLQRLFGSGDAESTALLPATHHFINPLPKGLLCYPSEKNNCLAYKRRFWRESKTRMVTGKPNLRPDDTLILFGSQASNLNARYIFGTPVSDQPVLRIRADQVKQSGLVGGWEAHLRWNFCSPLKSSELALILSGVEWKTKDHLIVDAIDSSSGGIIRPTSAEDEDYLLVTVLPRFARGRQRIVWFMGVHRTAQIAVDSLFLDPPLDELKKLAEALEEKTSASQYYQGQLYTCVIRKTELVLIHGSRLRTQDSSRSYHSLCRSD